MIHPRAHAEAYLDALDAYLLAKRRFDETPVCAVRDEDPTAYAVFRAAMRAMHAARSRVVDLLEMSGPRPTSLEALEALEAPDAPDAPQAS